MELFRLLGTIAIDSTNAKQEIDKYIEKAKESEAETSDAFSKIGSVAGKIAKGIGIAGIAIGGAFVGAIESTREYREQMGLLDAAYQTAGHSSEVAKQTYSDLNAVLGDTGQAVEAAQHLAKLTDNEKDLQTWTNICAGVYATFGASLPIEGLTEAANETAKTGILTGGLTDALNWAGISEEKFQEKLDACTNEQERQKLIMDTLNTTYKDASTQYQETNADIIASRQAQERLTDAMAEVGRVGEPIMTAIKNAIASMAETAVPIIEKLVNGFRDAVTWIQKNQETVQTWIGVILGASVTVGTFLLILNWSKIMTAAANAIKVVRLAVLGFNAALLANPVGVVVALLAGLVAAFIYLWNNVEGFRKFWIKTWDLIKNAASKAWSAIKKAFNNIGSWFSGKFKQVQKAGQDAMKNVQKWFSNAYKSVTRTFSNIGSWFGGKFRSAWNSIKNAFSGWGSFFSGLWGKVKSKFGSIGSSIGTAMGNAVKNGMNGALSKVESAINKGIGLINSAIRLANKLPGINVGTVGKISLPRLAKGGVLERGQVGILEGSGAEAVVPLENNRAWLSRLAVELDQIQNGRAPQYAGNDRVEALLEHIIVLLESMQRRQICLDSGVLVGELAEPMNRRLGEIYNKNNRGYTR
ncbi:MAG: hypothetical protein IJZ23_06865 [Roseburia sp.]|nr:hypothetical protein [Roseburia sp.]MBQ8279546.1 hypothetical protein [Roseburia sp.]